ncbi:MAG: hypothetical protein HC790_02125 [Acaryochloridaceae cyanobacterium CSU_3_4]|nr:hypothetical protein [Acaryochloridaceae cyanobacterium CSU_3_4]
MEHYFPGLVESLQQGGATLADFGQAARWHISGDYRLQYESRLTGILMSRPFLESEIRRRVMLLPNLTVLDESRVEELIATAEGSQIVGVRVKCAVEGSDCLTLNANLVVDASGRGSASPRWLMALGYDKPQETIVKVDLGYATRLYRRQASDLTTAKLAIVSADPPHCPRSGVIFPIEGDRWIVTLPVGEATDLPLTSRVF